jgi:HEAT repeat protein
MVSKPKTAAELLKELQSDPEYRARKQRQEKEHQLTLERARREEQPLVDELKSVGIEVQSAWDLVNRREPYPTAIPVLLKHLHRDYTAKTREGIARALAVYDSAPHWDELLQLFRSEVVDTPNGVKWALACCLAAIAGREQLEDLKEIVLDPSHGQNRAIIVRALGDLPGDDVVETVERLVDDADVSAEAKIALRQLRRGRRSNRKPDPRGVH